MNNELLFLRQMLSTDYLPLVVLGGLFVALLFRSEAISSPGLFRWGYIFFILSLVAPAAIRSFYVANPRPSAKARASGRKELHSPCST